MWNYVEWPLNRLFRMKKKLHFLRGFVNCNHQHIKFLAALSAKNTIGQSTRLGDQVIFLTRPKPNVSGLRWPGTVRAQPCVDCGRGYHVCGYEHPAWLPQVPKPQAHLANECTGNSYPRLLLTAWEIWNWTPNIIGGKDVFFFNFRSSLVPFFNDKINTLVW